MNYAPSILDYLAQSPDLTEVLLAPGSLPMRRDTNGMTPIGEAPLTEQDVRDTLTTLIAHGKTIGPNAKSGVFSFGIPQRGRFRVGFLTQRGTFAARILKVPLEVPQLTALLAEATEAEAIEQKFLSLRSGLLLITSGSPMAANLFAYALLRACNEHMQRTIFIIEPGITFLMRHQHSVILQSEIGTDVEDMGQALRAAMYLNPDLLYIRDINSVRDLDLVSQAVETHVFCMATIPILDAAALVNHSRETMTEHSLRGLWHLDQEENKKLRILMS
jgi:twitching motility protein PilT